MKKRFFEEDKWEATGSGNFILHFDGGYLSYNPDTEYSKSISLFGFIESLGNMLGFESSGEETAFGYKDGWYVLNGDFRKEYEKCSSVKELKSVYKINKNKKSDWATK